MVPIPTLLLKASMLNRLPLISKALVTRDRFKLAVPEVEVKFSAPVDRVNPFWAVKVPPEVTDPAPVAEILPEVVILSPVYTGERVVSVLPQNPFVPPDEPTPIEPKQVNVPVVESRVQPLLDDPPARLTNPPVPGVKFRLVPGTDAPMPTLPDPVKVRAVDVKVLVLMVELKVAAPATVKVPVLLKATPPIPEVVRLKPAIAMSVEASKVMLSLNWAKSKELPVIELPGKVAIQEALPKASEVKI